MSRRALLAAFAFGAACSPPRTAPIPSSIVIPPATPPPEREVPPTAQPTVEAPAPPLPDRCLPGSPVRDDQVGTPLQGSFSKAGADEVVGQIACDGDDLGGLALLRRVDGVLRTVRFEHRIDYRQGVPECAALRTAGGRDLAVCKTGSASWGEVHTGVEVIDYAKTDEEDHPRLVSVVDNTATACSGETELTIGSVLGMKLVDVDRDGYDDVRIEVRAARVRIAKQAPCETVGAVTRTPSAPLKLPPAPKIVLEFLARGTALVPTPATAKALRKIAATEPR